MDKLQEARQIINETDAEMAKLFARRMRAVEQIAAYKKASGMPIEDRGREAALKDRNLAALPDRDLEEYYLRFLESVMQISKSYQYRRTVGMKVAYCGTEGAFAQLAAKQLFPSATLLPFGSFERAYLAAQTGECDAVILPIENSDNGEVGKVSDLIFEGPLTVSCAIDLPITHDLLGIPGAQTADIKEVVSHAQALGQCDTYIRKHRFATREYANTALAAEYVAKQQDPHLAAIASAQAAEHFGLCVLERNINQSRTNTTRFLVLSAMHPQDKAEDEGMRSVLVFTVNHEAGALAKAIEVIGRYGYNMAAIRSRPVKGSLWQYYFYIELEGNLDTAQGKEMLEELSAFCDRIKTAGSYRLMGGQG